MAACVAVALQALVDVHQIGMGETGNETWARNVLRVLEDGDGPGVDYAVSPAGLPQVPVAADRLHLVSGSSVRRLLWDVPQLLGRLRSQVVLTQYTLPATRTPGVVVIHDLSFERPEARAWIPARTLLRYKATIGGSARRARIVIAPTEHTRTALVEHYRLDPSRVLLAPLALDPGLAAAAAHHAGGSSYRRVLCVGTVLPRKNLPVVARAVRALRAAGEDVRLRLVGPLRPAGAADLGAMRALLGDALEVVGPVPLDQLAVEYAEADVLAYPSLYEGFGLPLLEAMAAGTPVVSSNATCLPEVAGVAALLVDPLDELAWVQALSSVLTSAELAHDLQERGRARAREFTWERTGAVVRQALELASG